MVTAAQWEFTERHAVNQCVADVTVRFRHESSSVSGGRVVHVQYQIHVLALGMCHDVCYRLYTCELSKQAVSCAVPRGCVTIYLI